MLIVLPPNRSRLAQASPMGTDGLPRSASGNNVAEEGSPRVAAVHNNELYRPLQVCIAVAEASNAVCSSCSSQELPACRSYALTLNVSKHAY